MGRRGKRRRHEERKPCLSAGNNSSADLQSGRPQRHQCNGCTEPEIRLRVARTCRWCKRLCIDDRWNIRANSQTVQQQIANLEQDSLSGDAGLNTEVSVLNKINASNVLTLRTLQDANNLRVAALEQQVLHAKQQRDIDAANLNFAIQMRQQSTQNLAPFNSNLTQSLTSYRLP